MNATRLYSLRYGGGHRNVLSVGRVQTPTLALIVERQHEIDNFKPEDFWELHTTYREADFSAAAGRFTDREKAQAAIESVARHELEITSVTKKQAARLHHACSTSLRCRWNATGVGDGPPRTP